MAATKGVNSYATVEEATAYFTDRLDATGWSSADAIRKWQSLVTATRMLDNLNWAGRVTDTEQPLAFPRVADYFDPRVGSTVSLDGAVVPSRVVNATFEQALHLLNNTGLLEDTGSVLGMDVAGIGLNSIKAAAKYPSPVMSLVRPLLVSSGANMWWRAN